jgi:hypothetical protein
MKKKRRRNWWLPDRAEFEIPTADDFEGMNRLETEVLDYHVNQYREFPRPVARPNIPTQVLEA